MYYKHCHIGNIIQVIDNELKVCKNEIKRSPDPDAFGLIDKQEQILGIGFALCQTFISSVCSDGNKIKMLSFPPFHKSGQSFAEITNACANYWKHIDEWKMESVGKREKYVIKVFNKLNVDIFGYYPISNAFCELVDSDGTFMNLFEYLNEWSHQIEIVYKEK